MNVPVWLMIGVPVALALVLAAVLAWRKLRTKSAPKPVPVAELPELAPASFGAAMRIMHPAVARSAYYDMPCVLVCGDGSDDKAAVLAAAGLKRVRGDGVVNSGWWQGATGSAFELPAEAWQSDAASWPVFLDLLDKHRPRRALDAMLWVIPLASLQAGEAALAANAARLSAKLADLQRRLGLQVPVYVLVSECDSAPGFAQLAGALPALVSEQSLGWSSPFSLGTPFQKSWAEEGLAAIITRLRALVSEVAVDGRPADGFSDLYLLPDALARQLAALPALLYLALRRNAALRAIDLRGFYLSARQRGADVAPAPDLFAPLPDTPASVAPAVFCRQLLVERIFAEFGLATQVRRKLCDVTGWRKALMWGGVAMAALWLVMLVPTYFDVRTRADAIIVPLAKVESSRREHLQRPDGQRTDGAVVEYNGADTAATLAVIESVPHWSLSSWWLPLSWSWNEHVGMGLDAQLQTILDNYFRLVVLRDIRDAMRERSDLLAQSGPSGPSAPTPGKSLGKVGSLPEFAAMSTFVDATLEYEHQQKKLQRLDREGRGDWADVASLMNYLFQTDLPIEHTVSGRHRFDDVIRHASAANDSDAAARVRRDEPARFRANMARLHGFWIKHRFSDNQITATSADIARDAAMLGEAVTRGDARLDNLVRRITDLQELLAQQGIVWVGGKISLGGDYAQLQAKIDRSTLLGATLRKELDARTVAAQEGFRLALDSQHGTRQTVLAYDEGKQLVVAPEYAALPDAYGQLTRYAFAQGEPRRPSELPGKVLVSWDPARLEAARAVEQEHAAYEAKLLEKAPPRFHAALQSSARERAAAHLHEELAQAAVPAPPGADWRVANFEAARVAVPPLLAALRKMGQPARVEQWQWLLDEQAGLLLGLLQAELNNRKLYLPDATVVAGWNGGRNGALQAYGAYVVADLPDYLMAQADEASALSDAAKGPRLWLEAAGPLRQRAWAAPLASWNRVAAELAKHAAKDPASTVLRLEQLITVDLNAIDSANCADKLVRMQRSRNVDYFQRQGQHAMNIYALRCSELQADGARKAYQSIAELYNAMLLERYPFAASMDAPPAAPEHVRHLLLLLETHQKEVRSWLERQDNAGAAALAFIDSLENARPLLSAILQREPVSGAPAALDLWPEFRINRVRERGADQIIAWDVETGAFQTIGAGALNWRLGDPLTLRLRWARDSAYEPAPDPARYPGLQVEAKKASWHYDGQWALLKMLSAHAAAPSELAARDAIAPQALRFSVPTRDARGQASSDAVAYARLGVSVHGKPERLALPAFPTTRAPPLLPPPSSSGGVSAPVSASLDKH
jgi:type VI secretion system protein ImpL